MFSCRAALVRAARAAHAVCPLGSMARPSGVALAPPVTLEGPELQSRAGSCCRERQGDARECRERRLQAQPGRVGSGRALPAALPGSRCRCHVPSCTRDPARIPDGHSAGAAGAVAGAGAAGCPRSVRRGPARAGAEAGARWPRGPGRCPVPGLRGRGCPPSTGSDFSSKTAAEIPASRQARPPRRGGAGRP